MAEESDPGYGGFYVTFLDTSPLERECSICHRAFRDPVQTSCGHRFCKMCITKVISEHPRCPLDNELIDKDEKLFQDNAFLKETLNPSRITCGCEWTGTYEEFVDNNHASTCGFMITKCPNKDCDETFLKNVLEEHKGECPWEKIKCIYCGDDIIRKDKQSHEEQCIQFPVQCTRCLIHVIKEIPRQMLKEHIDNECVKTKIRCPYLSSGCDFIVERDMMEAHVKDQVNKHLLLVQKQLTQDHQQIVETHKKEIAQAREEIAKLKHENDEQQKQLTEVHQQIVQDHQIVETHKKEITQAHEEITKLKHEKDDQKEQLAQVHQQIAQDHQQITQVQQIVETDKKEITQAREEIAKLNNEKDGQQKQLTQVHQQIAQDRQQIAQDHQQIIQDHQQIAQVHQIVETREKEITNARKEIAKLIQEKDDQQKQIVQLKWNLTSFQRWGESFANFWEIPGITEKLKTKKVLLSDKFYTEPGDSGYRFQLWLESRNCPRRGTATLSNTFIGLYLHLCSGDHDDALTWPFKPEYTLTIVNQAEKPDKQLSIKPGKAPEDYINNCFPKPDESEPNLSFGSSCFISHNDLTRGFIRNDKILLKCQVRLTNQSTGDW